MKRIWIEALCLVGLLILFNGVELIGCTAQGDSEPQQESETAVEATESQPEPEDESPRK